MSDKEISNLKAIIDFAWAAGASKDLVNEAQKELKILVDSVQNLKNIQVEN